MSNQVDLQELAIDRGDAGRQNLRLRQHVLTRYVLPLVLIAGFLGLVAWASRDLVFPPTPVTVVPVISSTVEVRPEGTPLFKAAGWVEPRPTPVRVAALAPGVVEQLLVVEDQPVKAGEPVAKLVQEDAKLAYDRAIADLELRQAELDEANAALTAAETRFTQPVHLRAALGEAQASLAKIETQLKNLPFELRRAEADYLAMKKDYEGKLAARGVVAGVAIDLAKSKADAAQALVEELRDRAGSLENERSALSHRRDALRTQLQLLADETKAKDESKARVRAAKARVAQARVAVAQAQLQLDRMTVVSPIEGRVFRLVAEPGARLSAGMGNEQGSDGSTVVTLYRPDRLQIRVDVRFEDIPKVSLDQPVQIENPALNQPLTGNVLFISSEADIQKNTLQVKIDVPDPPSVFKPEMLVDVTFLAPKPRQQPSNASQELALYVPQQLVKQDDDGTHVWIADQSEGIARKVLIETRTAAKGLVQVTRGLTVASRLIVGGRENLRDGDRITVTGEDGSLGTRSSLDSGEPAPE